MATVINSSVPVWLGVVSPLPVGFVYNGSSTSGSVIKAGTPVIYVEKSSSTSATFKEVTTSTDVTGAASGTKFGYLYNDVVIGSYDGATGNTGAVVIAHAEGILIDRVCDSATATAMATACPGVVQVKGY